MKKILVVLLSAIALLSGGCNKFLDTVPDNRTEIDNIEKVRRLLANAYPRTAYAAILEARCDGMTNFGTTYNGGQQNESFECLRAGFYWMPQVQVDTDDSYERFWEDCYRAISYCNFALEALEDVSGSAQEVRLLRAEAKVSRAYHHFLLLSLFSNMFEAGKESSNPGIPYVTVPEDMVFKQYERGTVASTLAMIEDDLFTEIENLGGPSSYAQPKFRFTRDTGYALAVRYYLFRRNYSKVIEYANKLLPNANPSMYIPGVGTNIDGSNKNYVSPDDSAYKYFKNTLLDMQVYRSMGTDLYQPGIYFTNPDNTSFLLSSEVGTITWRAFLGTLLVNFAYNLDTIKGIASNNPTGGQWAMPVLQFSNDPTAFVIKYYEDMLLVNESAGVGYVYNKINLFRLEEVLLARAEAKAMMGDFQGAIDDLNMYVPTKINTYTYANHRMDLDKIVNYYTNEAGAGTSFVNEKLNNDALAGFETQRLTILKSLLLAIMDFRRAEFLYEGMRYWDILRWNIQVSHHCEVTNQTKTLYPSDDNRVLQLPSSTVLNGLAPNPMKNITERWNGVIYE